MQNAKFFLVVRREMAEEGWCGFDYMGRVIRVSK